jgi:GxxExxY protein
LVEDLVLVEIKSLERWNPLFVAQMMTYLRLMEKRVGLVVNFNTRLLKEGITRIVL